MTAAHEMIHARRRRWSVNSLVDNLFFVFSGGASVWLAWLVLDESLRGGWSRLWLTLPFWAVLAYVALPRLHRILTNIYVPDYFIGRSRTADGLLGDPINLAVRGSQRQLETTMLAAGWTKADEITLLSSWRIVIATLTGRSYLKAPVSSLMLFGRQQDFAFQQEVADSPAKRHHVRFWRCPDGWLLPGGHQADWLAAGTFDRSVGLSLFTFQITHKIDANIDQERDHIVQTMRAVDPSVSVQVIEDFSTGYHSRNGGGDEITTDGDLPIVNVREIAVQEVSELHASGAVIPGTSVDVPTLERPLPTIFGAFFGLFTAVVTIILGVSFLTSDELERVLAEAGYNPIELAQLSSGVTLITLIPLGLLALFQIAVAYFVWHGHNWARIALMAATALSLIITAASTAQGERISLSTNLLGITLDIFAVLALSSEKARAFARNRRA
ncbi:LssY C-terminal domain-containing protein [Psychromicrobium sp. YIM B11713]|uniref:LssY C-terminal domain-containing protein n=1 Tax=Psychromicrobium sp. YIM B11713 TaxID=3145233 RepID=UPI00374E8156